MRATLTLGVVGSVLTLVLLFELLRRKHLREKYAVFWAIVAVMTLAVAAFPQSLFWLSDVLGCGSPGEPAVLHREHGALGSECAAQS